MKKFFSNFIGKFVRLARHLSRQNIRSHAAAAGYFIVLSVFPLLVMILALLRYTGLEVETLSNFVGNFLPDALAPYIKRLIEGAYRNTSGTVVSVSAVTGLWSASQGVHCLLNGLNAIYKAPETRSYIRTRLLSIFYTVLFIILLFATLVLNVFGATLLRNLHFENITLLQFLWDLVHQRFILMMLLQTGLFSAMYMALPNRRISFRAALPGALLSSAGWLIFSSLYSIYVRHFAAYANIYGSVYMVALSMLWLYFCLSIVFCGGALNHYLATETNYTKGANYGTEK